MEKSKIKKDLVNFVANFKLWFTHRWGLALMSLIFAILAWNLLISDADPQRQKRIADVPVSIQGTDVLKGKQLTIKGTAETGQTATVRLEMPRSEMLRSTNADVTAYLDLSTINAAGTYDVPVKAVASRGTVVAVYPQTVKLVVEKLGTRLVPVKTRLEGDLPDDMWHSDPVLSVQQLRVSGAASDVEKIDHVQVSVDITDMRGEASATCDFEFLDADGRLLDAEAYSCETPNCVVRMNVYPEKIMAVQAEEFLVGTPAEGYEVSSVSVYPAQLHLVGEEAVLNNITQLQLTPMSIQGVDADQTFTVNVALPAGVTAQESTELVVIARVTPKVVETVLSNVPVEVRNIPAGLTLQTPVTVSVTMAAEENHARGIRGAELELYVDAAGLNAGVHALEVKTEAAVNSSRIKSITVQPAQVTVNLAKK